ncbi:hypothetical protein EV217_5006 [Phyllobacterium myrsinacearum]|uniref:hypothetical protein n=1 Tax=Phyllobacterium myrsinacearum TaxID=28101 RepID=UPI00102999A7|nr:hypothetical protein [Phyllobacterium myrsinacearum]RZS76783.1 hypothetical protein EV217_5006 [Phyllobacterium myrsinacearum]
MADKNISTADEAESIDNGIAAPKKQRAPRRTKAAIAAAAEAAPPAIKRRKPRGKNVAQTAKRTAAKPVLATDELAELLRLEEDNKRLRKELAAKLRTENANLRKRLGLG